MTGLLLPFLVGDAVLGGFLLHHWRHRPAGSAPLMERRLHTLMLGRMAVLLALSLVGTVAVLRT